MGCGGFYGGCGPCGGGAYNNFNDGYANGYCGDANRAAYGQNYNDVVCNNREVYYEKENCFRSDNASCCADVENANCNNWNQGCANGSCGNYGGCGPYGGGCGPVGGCGYGGGCGPYGGGYGGPRRYGYGGYGPYKKGYGKNYGTPNGKLHKNLGYNAAKKSGHHD